jgi:hypothetical protein
LDIPNVLLPDGAQLGKKDFAYRFSDQDATRFDAIREKTTIARQQGKRGSVDLSFHPGSFALRSRCQKALFWQLPISSHQRQNALLLSRAKLTCFVSHKPQVHCKI